MRLGSTTTECSISDDDDDSSATQWMLITVFVWLGMMALVWLIYTCRKASRRRRLLKNTLVPLLKLLGLNVTFVDDARDEGRGEQPPPYELGNWRVLALVLDF
ncbi:hypothetical protein C0Q70_14883 [Pomacea canaliculata]|uniref:Uncharacterized protein n=1 Tax=Pomacea canaliculata TaxID=400727 RepID=A0A2T7NTA9_POMCA|nr:hypothetical protein C0Q70_14883 [Pomacea canaliculata]